MIEVHHLEHSRSQRILWLLEELELPYKVTRYGRDPKTELAPPELLSIHPLGKSPVITDGDITVAESGAIIEYLVEKAGNKLKPAAGTQEARDYTYWLHFAEGSAMPFLVMTLVFNKVENPPLPFFLKPLVLPIAREISKQVKKTFLEPNLNRQLQYIDDILAEKDWLCGNDMTAADVMMSFPLEAACTRADVARKYPNIQNYVDRIHAMPTYKKALEVGGPYNFA